MRPRTRHVLELVLEILVPIVLVAILWGWTAQSDTFYYPPLQDVFEKFGDTWLFERVDSDVWPSLRRMFVGYAIAVILAIIAGTALGGSRTLRRATAPIVEFLRSIPPPALLPFAIVVIGVGDDMKIFIIAFVCLWPVLLNTIDGINGIDPTLRDIARVYGVSGRDRLVRMTLPAASPQIFAGMRLSLSLAVILMVISEMVASTNGIGFFVLQSQRSFAIPEMWSGILLLGILGYVLNLAFVIVERRVLAWHRGAKASALS
jgi:ABC-type nitrate/sulfonate/bicarbonate transport system permease component